MSKLTAKQQRFCDEYLIDLNATQAAIRAGYSPNTARFASQWINEKNLKKPTSKYIPALRSYIDEQLSHIHDEKTADAQEVLEYLTAVMRGQHQEQVLRLAGDGVQEIAAVDVSARDRLKAAELLGKRYGLYTDRVNEIVDLDLNISIDYGDDRS
jgi:phage terminase small subunit